MDSPIHTLPIFCNIASVFHNSVFNTSYWVFQQKKTKLSISQKISYIFVKRGLLVIKMVFRFSYFFLPSTR